MPTTPWGKWIRPEKRLAIYLRDEFRCVYCDQNLANISDPRSITLDHIKTKSRGGGNEAHNLITACRKCNSRRGCAKICVWADTSTLTAIRRQTRRKLPKYLKIARKILLGREEND